MKYKLQVVYMIAIVRTTRNITSWQRSVAEGKARVALLILGYTGLVVLLPVMLAFVLLQNPAP
jgi:hypothetical protein